MAVPSATSEGAVPTRIPAETADAAAASAEVVAERVMEYLLQRRELAADMLQRLGEGRGGMLERRELGDALRRMGVGLSQLELDVRPRCSIFFFGLTSEHADGERRGPVQI